MEALGFGRFAVVGHDRGARVAYRMALDHPERVERLAVLNVIPTVDQFERMTGGPSLGYWPWFLLALPAPFPEQLIAAAPEQFLRFVFDSWTADPTAIDDDAFAVYLAAFSPAAAAICADYRASFWLDYEHDAMIDGSAVHRVPDARHHRSRGGTTRRRRRRLARMGTRRQRAHRTRRTLHPGGSTRRQSCSRRSSRPADGGCTNRLPTRLTAKCRRSELPGQVPWAFGFARLWHFAERGNRPSVSSRLVACL